MGRSDKPNSFVYLTFNTQKDYQNEERWNRGAIKSKKNGDI